MSELAPWADKYIQLVRGSRAREVEEHLMNQILANDRVRLEEDLPELSLYRGAEGVVRSSWTYPNRAYEVEFRSPDAYFPSRILLLHEQVTLQGHRP